MKNSSNEVHCDRNSDGRVFMLFRNVMFFRLIQDMKHFDPILFTEEGIVIDINEVK